MKQTFNKLAMVALLLISALTSVSAYDFEVDGIYYSVVSDSDLTCKVTSGDIKYTGDVVIPSTVTYENRTLTVTSIGFSAFENCSALTSISIPNSVASIAKEAFKYCSSLKSVTIGNSVTSIGYGAFYGCSGLTGISIPNSVARIGGYAFYLCSELKGLVFEDGESTLYVSYNHNNYNGSFSTGLFYGCPIETVYIGRNLSYSSEKYSRLPFKGKENIISVTIGDSVTTIDNNAFEDCI